MLFLIIIVSANLGETIMKFSATGLAITLMVSILAITLLPSYGSPESDTSFSRLNVQVELYENSTAKVMMIVRVHVSSDSNKSIESLYFPIVPIGRARTVQHIGVKDYSSLSGNISLEKIQNESFSDLLVVRFLKPVEPGETTEFSFVFTVKPDTILAKVGNDKYRFVYRLYMPNLTVNPNLSTIRVLLPVGASVSKIQGPNVSLQMDPLSERLVAVWEPFGKPTGLGWEFFMEFRLTEEVRTVIKPPEEVNQTSLSQTGNESSFPLMEFALILLLSNIATGASTLLLSRRFLSRKVISKESWSLPAQEAEELSEEQIQEYRDLLERLDRDESSIVKILADSGGRMEQKDLPEMTGFSKSKVSRILKRLDSLGVIRRTSSGKTKIVELNPVLREILKE